MIGIDPGPVAPQVLGHRSGFTHLRRPFAELERRELPRRFDWLLLDVNLAPTIALRYVEELLRTTGARPRHAVLTLKLNEWSLVERAPEWLSQLSQMGLSPMGPAHLPAFRQEVGVVAFVQRGRPR